MISHKHKIIFIHIPKCAGTSITTSIDDEQEISHHTAIYYANNFPEEWNNYIVFTVVRHPLDRLVSIYTYLKTSGYHDQHEVAQPDNFKDWLIANIEAYNNNGEESILSSEQGLREKDYAMGSAFWFGPQCKRIADEKGCLYPNIHIFSFERIHALQQCITIITGNIGDFPYLNKSDHKHYVEYYDDELFKIVSEFKPVREDCQAFHYSFKNLNLHDTIALLHL